MYVGPDGAPNHFSFVLRLICFQGGPTSAYTIDTLSALATTKISFNFLFLN